ncbi:MULTISPECIES: diacylglycerol kinase family protein [Bacillaceae]|uniref:Undecaprenol kinase n=1 Tax=Peribacillus huizhouensis TaxID=1501239 RepID=A0ABR6CK89_9BACI|nr:MULTISPECIES: diacylglycerol kinase family protein [Bacillaceae]MBA9025474.1 undecaprenol kinase [Peribacillus huizhouensis]
MGLKETKPKSPLNKSFGYAFSGIIQAIKSERNMKIHVVTALIVICFGFYFSLSGIEWLFILLAISGTITLEMVNSSIERAIDLATDQIHPLAKEAKDFAAGAVLIYAIFSVIIGIIIFLPKIVA